jgi:23S rRNA (uracil1939-C5)-methyltransferase
MSFEVKITSLTYGGAGLGRMDGDGKVVFVPFTAPGDVAEVEPVVEKKGFIEARLLNVKEASSLRREPPCPVFGICGGCQLQHMDYSAQLQWKQRIFTDTLSRIGGVEFKDTVEIIASAEEFNYRHRAGFHVRDGKWGFFESGSHKIVEIESCPLLTEPINTAFKALKELNIGKEVYKVELAHGDEDSSVVALFYVSEATGFGWTGRLLEEGVEGKESIVKGFEVRLKDIEKTGRGKRLMKEGRTKTRHMASEYSINTEVSSFAQVNAGQNKMLVQKVLEFAGSSENDVAMDLFCGTGNLSLPLSGNFEKVVALDSDKDAISEARSNAAFNEIDNIEFIAARAGRAVFSGFRKKDGSGKIAPDKSKSLESGFPHVVILDPSRSGAKDVMKALLEVLPDRVVYVSCDPSTLARDLKMLTQSEYKVTQGVVLDMFPQSYHIEAIVTLKRKGVKKAGA